jgi:murein DD-endopeptidase MepM/ murein hydrolase activator NlpD
VAYVTLCHNYPAISRLFDRVDRFQSTVNKLNGAWNWPVFGKVTQEFNDNNHGIDIAANEGTPVRSIGKGLVKTIGNDPTYGLVIIIDHGSGLETVYAHNSKVLVKEGYPVLSGTKISEVGSTGNSNGPHLHFEVRKDGVTVNPRDFLE